MDLSTCPESISDNPKSALGWLSQFAYFLRFHFQTFFEKVNLPQALWNFVQGQQVTSGDPLLITCPKRKSGSKLFYSLFFDLRATQSFVPPKITTNKKRKCFMLSLLGFILQRLCQTSSPCRVPSKELISWDFRPWKSALGATRL